MKAEAVKYQEITAMEGFKTRTKSTIAGRDWTGGNGTALGQPVSPSVEGLTYVQADVHSQEPHRDKWKSTPGWKTQLPYPTTEMQ